MSRRAPTLALLVVALGLMPAHAEDGYAPTTLSVGVGMHVPLYKDTPFGRQLGDAGYAFGAPEPSFTVTALHALTGWLAVGGELHLRVSSQVRDATAAGVVGSRWERAESGLTQLTARALVQLAPWLADVGAVTGLQFGVQLGLGAGPTFWWLRGETETAAHLDLMAALVWNVRLTRGFGFGLRLMHHAVLQEGLGPRDIGFGPTWSPTVELRLEHAW